MMFAAKLFIGIGEKSHFYTLRETYLHEFYIDGKRHAEVRSFHHWNLSQNPAEAIAKAEEDALQLGVPFAGATVEKLGEQLAEIKRADAAEIERREREHAAWQVFWEARRAEQDLIQCEYAAQGIVPGRGACAGKHLLNVPRSFINWLLAKRAEFAEGSAMRVLAEHALFFYEERALPVPSSEVLGQPGQRIECEATVIRQYKIEGFYGIRYITTMVEHKTGACLVVFSGAFRPEVEDVLKFKATVKGHMEFRGQPQTILQRVKEIA